MGRRSGQKRAVAADAPLAPAPPAEAAAGPSSPTARPRLLVVDDSPDAQELFRLHLERTGYEVTTANDGRDALELLARGQLPALIIVDLLMPVMDGMELIDSIRSDQRMADVPVLVVSAVDVPKPARLPHTSYLRKPFRNAELLAHIEQLVGPSVRPTP
jgi:CheY-like chemotaxis protein